MAQSQAIDAMLPGRFTPHPVAGPRHVPPAPPPPPAHRKRGGNGAPVGKHANAAQDIHTGAPIDMHTSAAQDIHTGAPVDKHTSAAQNIHMGVPIDVPNRDRSRSPVPISVDAGRD